MDRGLGLDQPGSREAFLDEAVGPFDVDLRYIAGPVFSAWSPLGRTAYTLQASWEVCRCLGVIRVAQCVSVPFGWEDYQEISLDSFVSPRRWPARGLRMKWPAMHTGHRPTGSTIYRSRRSARRSDVAAGSPSLWARDQSRTA